MNREILSSCENSGDVHFLCHGKNVASYLMIEGCVKHMGFSSLEVLPRLVIRDEGYAHGSWTCKNCVNEERGQIIVGGASIPTRR